jgi:cystathionine beta-lyase family protein involved in aluminum resistance
MLDNTYKFLKQNFGIKEKILKLSRQVEIDIKDILDKHEDIKLYNQAKVLYSMQKNKLSSSHFNCVYGYGYGDISREITEKIYADIFKTEDALVRQQISSGTQSIIIALKASLNFGD